jgi:hypothetical protein
LRRPSGDQDGTADGKKAGDETVPDSFTTSGNEDICRAHFESGSHDNQRTSQMSSPQFHFAHVASQLKFHLGQQPDVAGCHLL